MKPDAGWEKGGGEPLRIKAKRTDGRRLRLRRRFRLRLRRLGLGVGVG